MEIIIGMRTQLLGQLRASGKVSYVEHLLILHVSKLQVMPASVVFISHYVSVFMSVYSSLYSELFLIDKIKHYTGCSGKLYGHGL